ncbi:major facilitator superfamily transporter [Candidatus Vecturithrix granuli]|uniref:Major facilitator superfamily transporter n=1 Tax=Vecturithrix granuli TaxID=1499967 RepID=A0A081BTY9_VECG1|nr:major facilitator superfamily transporter [Candidatus Vecturithrix granuli]
MNNNDHETAYRWYVLTLAALTHTFVAAMPLMCLPVLFQEISNDLGLSLVQIGVVWGLVSLPGVVTSLAGGMIGDRFGVRRTLTIICGLAGITSALRGCSINFLTLSATMFLFGMVRQMIPMNVHKTCGLWFSSRQLGLANGVVSMGMALGFMAGSMLSATFLSPWLGGWRNVLFFYGAICLGLTLPWHFLRPASGELKHSSESRSARSLRQTLVDVMQIKAVWLLGLALFGISGCVQGTLGYLPLYLRGIGWAQTAADGTLAAFHGVSLLCVIPLALWSDRPGARKRVLLITTLMLILGVVLLALVNSVMIWGAVIIAGFARDGFMAIFMTTVIEIKGIGSAYAGTAIGLVMSVMGLGNLLAPPLGNSLAGMSPGWPFLFWALLAAAGLYSLHLALSPES